MCKYSVYKLPINKQEELKKDLEKLLEESTFGKTGGLIKLPKDFKIHALKDCFIVNDCQYQVCLNRRLYCINKNK